MVLLNNDNLVTIKQHHILKCLEQKKKSFNIFIISPSLKENNDDKLDKNAVENITDVTDSDIKMMFPSK
jgi:hypothetical protein